MTSTTKFIFLKIFTILLALFVNSESYGGQALLIGVSTYPESPLSNPVNDVNLISKSLSAKGWVTRTLINPTSKELKDTVRNFFSENKSNTEPSILYFSGHGIQFKGENYLLPTDIQGSQIILNKAISITEISFFAKDINGPKIFIIDACRSSPLGKDTISVSTGLNSQYAPPNSLIAYATAPGEVALDGVAGTNSPYATAFASSILTNNSLDAVFKKTRFDTMTATNGKQLPWESSSLYQDVSISIKNIQASTNISNKPIELIPETTKPTKTETSVQVAMPTLAVGNLDSFAAALDNLKNTIEKSSIQSFSKRNGSSSDEKDKLDFLASIDVDKNRFNVNPSGVAYGLINAFQTGIYHPKCRSKNGIDANCGDYDRFFRFTPNLKLSLELSKIADVQKIRSDKLANHYKNGWGVDKDLIKAYELFESDKNKGGVVADYWWTNINEMVQTELINLGYKVNIDGDFGPASCRALSEIIGKTNCGRVVSKSQLISMVSKSTRSYK